MTRVGRFRKAVVTQLEQQDRAGDEALRERLYESLKDEHDYEVTEIEGRLPADLTGTLFRIGPGKFEVGQTRLSTIFEGDGMVSRFILDGKGVHFTNRYVRTQQLADGLRTNRLRRPGLATLAPKRGLGNLRVPANVANTNVVPLAGELLACWEFGNPHRLDPDTLETLGTTDFDDRLGYLGAFSAHPKWDPETGEMFNFGLDLFPTPRLRCYRIARDGTCTQINSARLWKMKWNHDFALTQKYMVFVIDPVLLPSVGALVRTRSLASAIDYDHNHGYSTFILVPRDGSKPRIIQHDPQLHIHMTNAYEDGDDTMVEFVRYTSIDYLKQYQGEFVTNLRAGEPRHRLPAWPASHLVRFRISPSNRITEEVLTPTTAIEFPQYDWRRSSVEHTITYTASSTDLKATFHNGIAAFNHARGTSTGHHEDGCSYGEPIFVARPDSLTEDDGWLLALRHNLRSHRSALVVLDAARLDNGPVAIAHLRHHIPVGFHGTFTRRIAKPEAFVPHPEDIPIR